MRLLSLKVAFKASVFATFWKNKFQSVSAPRLLSSMPPASFLVISPAIPLLCPKRQLKATMLSSWLFERNPDGITLPASWLFTDNPTGLMGIRKTLLLSWSLSITMLLVGFYL
jgi:hypothetical protein